MLIKRTNANEGSSWRRDPALLIFLQSRGAVKTPRETTGRPRQRSIAPFFSCCGDELNLFSTTQTQLRSVRPNSNGFDSR